jgi:CMP/dCMP kinase
MSIEQEELLMKDDIDAIDRMRAITLSREYGSGGGEIASLLAQRLGWQLVDHAIVERTALELGTSSQEAEAHDEITEGIVVRMLSSMQYLYPAVMADAPRAAFLASADYRGVVNRIVRAAASRGHVVIVGRASQVILSGLRDVLRVRIVAPLDKRVAYVMQREGVDKRTAEARIQMKDHHRERYLQVEYHQKAEDAHLYDLVLNMSLIDTQSAVEVIGLLLQQRARGLATPTGELGPARGLPRYPGRAGDFPASAH